MIVAKQIFDLPVVNFNESNKENLPLETKESEEIKRNKFFTEQQPDQWFPLGKSEEGKVQFVLPAELNGITRLIYMFRNRVYDRYLIGKTGGNLKQRCAAYASMINGAEAKEKVKKAGRKSFVEDITAHPEYFDVGILYALKPEEDLDEYETSFITLKGFTEDLYNDNKGGGGGLAHSEEAPTVYAVPKANMQLFTPEKYYSYIKNAEGQIRLQLSPGFWKRMSNYREKMEETQEFTYSIKNLTTSQRYIGVTAQPERRSKEHAYEAEYCDPENEKYDPKRIKGFLHPAMGQNPEQFAFGLMPVKALKAVEPEEKDNYVMLPTIAKVESYIIQEKKALFSENGFNANRGGGGTIARSCKKADCKRKLDEAFDMPESG